MNPAHERKGGRRADTRTRKKTAKRSTKSSGRGSSAKPVPRTKLDVPRGADPAEKKSVPVRARITPASRRSNGTARTVPGSRGKYVYCIVRSTEPLRFGAIGIGTKPSEVHTVNFRNIAAVVSDTPMELYDPTRENVLAHERVNETVMRQLTVIPMSFGTVFKTRDDIIELLRSAYDAFEDVLFKMQDKLEFGLKVLWDRDVIIREIEQQDEDARRLKSEISSRKGSTYFARMQYGRLMDAALQTRSEQFVADIFARLRDVSVASRANRPIGDKMIMNAAFLVARDKEGAFDARVKEIGAEYDKLTFKYTGPWPPYNFVNIRLKLERAKEDA